jgi:signal transduction histidine kinase/AraC-like DNA-binding protein/ligand-binding sensor domain-containing protein
MLIRACKFALAIGVNCALNFHLNAQANQDQTYFRFQHYSLKDGIANDVSAGVHHDSLGYSWTLNASGLSRFDGYNFKIFQYDEHDPARSALNFNIRRIFLDATGNIYLMEDLYSGGTPLVMAKYDPKSDRFVKYEINLKGSIQARGLCFERNNARVWAGTDPGKGMFSFDLRSGKTEEFMNPDDDPTRMKLQSTINNIYDFDAYLLVGTPVGLWIFDKEKKKFSRPSCNPKDSALLYQSPIVWFTKLKNEKDKNSIWFRTRGSLIKIDSTFSVVGRLENMRPSIHAYDTDEEAIWFAHNDGGLSRLNVADDSLTVIMADPADRHALQSNVVGDINIDRDMNVWMGTQQGVSRLVKNSIRYQNHNLHELVGSTIFQAGEEEVLIVNHQKKFLMASMKQGINNKMEFQEILSPIENGFVSGMWKGKKYLWASVTNGGGVRGYPINPETDRVEAGSAIHLRHDPNNINTIADNTSNGVWESPDGYLWVANVTRGICRVSTQIPYGMEGSVTRFRTDASDSNSIVSDRARAFFPEDNESTWVITWDGVDLMHFNETPVRFEHVFSRHDMPINLYRTSAGQLYLGTRNGLYLAVNEKGKYRFTFQPIAGKRSISAIQEDRLGRLWLKGDNSTLLCLDRERETLVEFNERDGVDHLRSLVYVGLVHGFHRTRDGKFIVVDQEGITFFDPESFKLERKPIVPVFTNLLVNNQPVQIGGRQGETENYAVPFHISFLSELVIDFRHNNFAIEFSAMDMTSPEKNLYRHKLEGFDADWIETDFKNRIASYTNLNPGSYVLKVKASNQHGVWSDREKVLHVRILPPPWKTWWAYTLYGTAFFGLLFLWRNYENKSLKLKHRADHLSELDTLKTHFFTNISHEFRTPITLILGPLKEMYKRAESEDEKSTFNTMIKNGQRLLHLINQLLDLSKLEAGKMTLRVVPMDAVLLTREITSSYESWALDKRIKYTFYSEIDELVVPVDQEKLEKIVHNLLSNAFKFTREGGEVIVHLKVYTADWFQITVKDSGIGIPTGQQARIFDRFYQVDNSKTRGYEGSGLGMALVKELVEIHHGQISLESVVGKGTTCTLRLPIGRNHFREDEIGETNGPGFISESLAYAGREANLERAAESPSTLNGEEPVILIVDDNSDMRHFIGKVLADSFQIVEADNGHNGLNKAGQIIPDLIISDVMMPGLDGFELCRRIKTNELTSHIPVILLTAKADHESKLTGLQTGADDYLFKPFDADELKAIVKNRIEEIRKLRDRFARAVTLEPSKISVTSLDEKFLTKIMDTIEAHMGDELFSLDVLSQESGYSNMHFYRKFKALTGQTPGAFLKTIRLKRAAALLAKNSDNVNQIGYSVGFSSPSYFNKCFKEQFGVTPGQYAESVKSS